MARRVVNRGAPPAPPPAAPPADDMSSWVADAPKRAAPPTAKASTATAERVVVTHDPTNEVAVLAAGARDTALLKRLAGKLPPDCFLSPINSDSWAALIDVARKGLTYDDAVLRKLHGDRIADHVKGCVEAREGLAEENLDWHVQTMQWDRARANVSLGPLPEFVRVLADPTSDPGRVRSLAKAIYTSFDGHAKSHVLDPGHVVRDLMRDFDARMADEGDHAHSIGIPSLDWYEEGHSPSLCAEEGCRGDRHRRIIAGTAPSKVTVVTARSGHCKALALDTFIATSSGWKTMGTIAVGDVVFDEDGKPCNVIHCSPVMVDRPCYEVVFSDGSKIVADQDHLWRTLTLNERRALVARAGGSQRANESRRKNGCVERREKVSTKLLDYWKDRRLEVDPVGVVRTTGEIAASIMHGKHRNHSVAVTRPLQLPPVPVPVDPYVLGAWLGDGESAGGRIYSADLPVVNQFTRAGYEVRKGSDKYGWSVIGLMRELRAIGVLGNKHVPRWYLRGSFEQRLALLQGLMDTDGNCTLAGDCEFVTTSNQLCVDVWELLSSLGIKSRPTTHRDTIDGRYVGDSWRFIFCTDLPVFRLKRKLRRMRKPSRGVHLKRYIVDVKKVPSVPVRCIQVDSPNSMYLAGWDMIPTHNTTLAANCALGIIGWDGELGDFVPGRRVLWGSWENRSPMNAELMAAISLGWRLAHVARPRSAPLDSVVRTREGRLALEERAHEISKRVRFMENPFWRERGQKPSNERNFDIVQTAIADSGCDVFIADLWDRCLVEDSPSDEKRSYFRARSMAEEEKVHMMLLVQQLLKGEVAMRADKRPSLEGVKGSTAVFDVADTMIAPHRPYLVKDVPDNKLEGIILKQRQGPWPLLVEFDWNAGRGSIANGRSMAYARPGEGGDGGNDAMSAWLGDGKRGGK